MGALIFVGFGYLVIQYGKPLKFAGGYVLLSSLISLIFGEKLISLLFVAAILFAYTAFVFMIVEYFSDSIFKPLLALAVGAFILFIGPIFM